MSRHSLAKHSVLRVFPGPQLCLARERRDISVSSAERSGDIYQAGAALLTGGGLTEAAGDQVDELKCDSIKLRAPTLRGVRW